MNLIKSVEKSKRLQHKQTLRYFVKSKKYKPGKKYWKIFHQKFADYPYNDLKHFDNYVGNNMKMLKAFFNYLNDEKLLNIENFHKSFYVVKEEIQIIVLLPEQLNHLIYCDSQ